MSGSDDRPGVDLKIDLDSDERGRLFVEGAMSRDGYPLCHIRLYCEPAYDASDAVSRLMRAWHALLDAGVVK